MTTTYKVARVRSLKIHPWVSPTTLKDFERLRIKLGFSRDGALDRAMKEFIGNHKGDANVTI